MPSLESIPLACGTQCITVGTVDKTMRVQKTDVFVRIFGLFLCTHEDANVEELQPVEIFDKLDDAMQAARYFAECYRIAYEQRFQLDDAHEYFCYPRGGRVTIGEAFAIEEGLDSFRRTLLDAKNMPS